MNTLLNNDTYNQQSRLASYCRTGELDDIKGLTENRVHHYRRLVYNVIDDTLQSAFPLTHTLLSEDEWGNSVNSFFANYNCQSYQVWKMPYEFYIFIKNSGTELKIKYPFLEELLLFEWTEIEIYMMADIPFPEVKINGSFEKDIVELNPEFKILKLEYPVHILNANLIDENSKGNYYVLIFREPGTGRVQFINLSFYFAWLVEKISIENLSLEQAAADVQELFNVDKQTIIINTIPFLDELKEKQFIIGFKAWAHQ